LFAEHRSGYPSDTALAEAAKKVVVGLLGAGQADVKAGHRSGAPRMTSPSLGKFEAETGG
jgi:hypothetical protein